MSATLSVASCGSSYDGHTRSSRRVVQRITMLTPRPPSLIAHSAACARALSPLLIHSHYPAFLSAKNSQSRFCCRFLRRVRYRGPCRWGSSRKYETVPAAGLQGVETFPENLDDFREVGRLGEMKIFL